MFEYLAAERPILALVPPDGAAAELIREAGAGVVVAPDDVDGMVAALQRSARTAGARARSRAPALSEELRERVSRRARVEDLARLCWRASDEAADELLLPRDAVRARRSRRSTGISPAASASPTCSRSSFSSLRGHDRAVARAAHHRHPARVLRRRSCSSTSSDTSTCGLRRARTVGQRDDEMGHPLRIPRGRRRVARAPRPALLLAGARLVQRGHLRQCASTASLQLLDARRGGNLDATLLSPITGGASQINVYGAVNGANVYRPNAMTGDPNHLGIMLIVPLLILTPIYLRLEKGSRWRRWLMPAIAFLLFVEAATLSRSGLLGLGVGALILAVPYRHYLRTPQLLVPISGALVVLLAIVLSRKSFFTTVLRSRVETSGNSESVHFSGVQLHPAGTAHRADLRARVEHVLGLLRVRHRQVELGPALLLRRADRRDRRGRHRALRRVHLLGVHTPSRRARARPQRSLRRAIRSRHGCGRSRGAARRHSPERSRRTRSI